MVKRRVRRCDISTLNHKISTTIDTYNIWREKHPTLRPNIDANKLANIRRDIIRKKRLTDTEMQMIKNRVSEEIGNVEQNHQENSITEIYAYAYALCVCLKHFTYPCRYADLVSSLGRPVPQLCMVKNHMVDYLFNRYGNLLKNLDQSWLAPQHLQMYADAIHNKGAPLGNCWGFIHATVRPICRPKVDQRRVYNGHKRAHASKFQSIVTPNSLIANLFGPVEGRRHDSGILAMSGPRPQLQHMSALPTGQAMCIYWHPSYLHRVYIQCSLARRQNLTVAEEAFNQSMSQVWMSVEWVFRDVVNYFQFTYFTKDLKLELSAVGKIYIVCALLRNALTCLYGNNTSAFFEVKPPTLEEYFG